MAIDLWNDDEEEFSGEYVQEGGGDFPVIPHETRVMAYPDKAEWLVKENYKNNKKEENCISLRFDIEDGEFKGQKVFKKCFIESDIEEQARKDYNMLMHIDANAGGKIKALKRAPDDEELQRYLINKSMVIVVGLMKGKNGDKDQNYIMGISSGKIKPESKKIVPPQKASAPARKVVDIEEEDLPF